MKGGIACSHLLLVMPVALSLWHCDEDRCAINHLQKFEAKERRILEALQTSQTAIAAFPVWDGFWTNCIRAHYGKTNVMYGCCSYQSTSVPQISQYPNSSGKSSSSILSSAKAKPSGIHVRTTSGTDGVGCSRITPLCLVKNILLAVMLRWLQLWMISSLYVQNPEANMANLCRWWNSVKVGFRRLPLNRPATKATRKCGDQEVEIADVGSSNRLLLDMFGSYVLEWAP